MRGLAATVLFFGLSEAATVFLSPHDSLPSRLSPQQANLVLAAHLGLEQFEVVDQPSRLNHLFMERDFVAQGERSALLLLLDETYACDVIPSTLQPSFTFVEPRPDALSKLLETSRRRASHVYTRVAGEPSGVPRHGVPRALDLFAAPTPANEALLAQLSTLVDFVDAPEEERFAALELTALPKLVSAYGRESEAYGRATEAVNAVVGAAAADASMRLAVVTYAPNKRRSAEVLADPPASAFGSCFGSEEACVDATDGCSGHGTCVNVTRAGQACFACKCTSTVSEAGKVQKWAGETCARRDVSGPFVLIAGTVITLILLMGGSVSLLYGISEQALPSILTGGVSGGAQKE